MTEYTSLEVSKRLAEKGFFEPTNGQWVQGLWGEGKGEWKLGIESQEWRHKREWYVISAYRSDTLLVWLLERGFIDYIMAAADGTFTVSFSDRQHATGKRESTAKTLPNAFGEVVMQVMQIKL